MDKKSKRIFRHQRIRRNLIGSTGRPRLCVYRSIKNLYAQVIDDTSGKVLFGMSTLTKDLRKKIKDGGNVEAASVLGEALAVKAKKEGVIKVCFDRGGYLYHGRVKAFAEAARKGGVEF